MVLVIIAVLCIVLSEYSRVIFFGIAGMVCVCELHTRLKEKGIHTTAWVMYVYLGIMVFLTLTHCGLMAYLAWFTGMVFTSLFSGILHRSVSGEGALYTLAGLSYPCFPFALLMIISASNRWGITIALGAVSCALCDTFALLGGKTFGKHKLAPDVSPNKTLEGTIIGALSSFLSAFLVYVFAKSHLNISYWQCLITSFCSSSMGQIGDLAESLLKRFIGIKDFSNLIPGHGGLFDRADSMMFSIPTAYFCLYAMHF